MAFGSASRIELSPIAGTEPISVVNQPVVGSSQTRGGESLDAVYSLSAAGLRGGVRRTLAETGTIDRNVAARSNASHAVGDGVAVCRNDTPSGLRLPRREKHGSVTKAVHPQRFSVTGTRAYSRGWDAPARRSVS